MNNTATTLLERTFARKSSGLVPSYPTREVIPITSTPLPVCTHRGEFTGESVGCQSCNGNVQLKVFSCEVYGTCTLGKRVESVPGCCQGCKDYQSVDSQPAGG